MQSLRAGHPRLLASADELARIQRDAHNDPLLEKLIARVVREADALLGAESLEHRLIGPRMLDQSRTAVRRVLTCAMAYRLTGEARFAERARRDMLQAAGFPDWNPSHFLDVA